MASDDAPGVVIPETNKLNQTLNDILQDKNTNLLPENLKAGITCLGINGTLTVGESGPIKLFETKQEMLDNTSAKPNDLAVIYRNEIVNGTSFTEFTKVTFPDTVVLPNAITSDFYCTLRSDTGIGDGNIMLSAEGFSFDYYGMSDMIRVGYSSSDGITYTRETDNSVVNFDNPIKCHHEEWNDNMGYFMQVNGDIFDGLYKYGPFNIDGEYIITVNSQKQFGNIKYKVPTLTKPDEVGSYDNHIIMIKESHLDSSGLFHIVDKASVLWTGGGYGKLMEYDELGIMLTIYDTSVPNTSLVLEEYDFTLESNKLSKNIINGYDDMSIFNDYTYLAQCRYTSSSDYDHKLYFVRFNDVVYANLSEADSKSYLVLPVNTEIPIDYTGYGYPSSITTSYFDTDFFTPVQDYKYILADTQFTLAKPDELLPGKIGYGKTGQIVGDGSIYDVLDKSKTYSTILVDKEQLPLFYRYGYNYFSSTPFTVSKAVFDKNSNMLFTMNRNEIQNEVHENIQDITFYDYNTNEIIYPWYKKDDGIITISTINPDTLEIKGNIVTLNHNMRSNNSEKEFYYDVENRDLYILTTTTFGGAALTLYKLNLDTLTETKYHTFSVSSGYTVSIIGLDKTLNNMYYHLEDYSSGIEIIRLTLSSNTKTSVYTMSNRYTGSFETPTKICFQTSQGTSSQRGLRYITKGTTTINTSSKEVFTTMAAGVTKSVYVTDDLTSVGSFGIFDDDFNKVSNTGISDYYKRTTSEDIITFYNQPMNYREFNITSKAVTVISTNFRAPEVLSVSSSKIMFPRYINDRVVKGIWQLDSKWYYATFVPYSVVELSSDIDGIPLLLTDNYTDTRMLCDFNYSFLLNNSSASLEE